MYLALIHRPLKANAFYDDGDYHHTPSAPPIPHAYEDGDDPFQGHERGSGGSSTTPTAVAVSGDGDEKPQGMDAIKAAIAARANLLGGVGAPPPPPPPPGQDGSSSTTTTTKPSAPPPEEEEDENLFDREDPYELFGSKAPKKSSGTPARVSTTDQVRCGSVVVVVVVVDDKHHDADNI